MFPLAVSVLFNYTVEILATILSTLIVGNPRAHLYTSYRKVLAGSQVLFNGARGFCKSLLTSCFFSQFILKQPQTEEKHAPMDHLADLGVLMEDFARLQDMTLTIARVDALAHIKLLLYP